MKDQQNSFENEKDQTYNGVLLWSEIILKAAHWLQFNSDDPVIHQKSDDIQWALNLLLNELVEIKQDYSTMFGELLSKLEAANVQEKILRVEICDVRNIIRSQDDLIKILQKKLGAEN